MSHIYDNTSISQLKGPDRVRLRPSVIFGSDDLRGCQQSFFEILSNSIDEAREGHGHEITLQRFKDHSIEVTDRGRGIPLDYNPNEKRYNWELVYCELYAGGKYKTNLGGNYEYSLGLNGLGACATQYASRWFDVAVTRDGYLYELHFEKGHNVGGLSKTPVKTTGTGTVQRWMPDDDVFTDIAIPADYFHTTLKQQAVINKGVTFEFIDEIEDTRTAYCYPEGILGMIRELNVGGITEPAFFNGEGVGRDRQDRPDYTVKCDVAFAFNNKVREILYYHNSSFLEYGGSPDRAVRSAFVSAFDNFLKNEGKYRANEAKVNFGDIEESLILMTSSFSTVTSYENQTKRSINNRFIQRFMTDLIRERLDIWFIEHREGALRAADQVLLNRRSREKAEKTRLAVKRDLMQQIDVTNRVKMFVDCRTQDITRREIYIVEGNSALGSVKMARNSEFQAVIPVRGKILNCLKADYNTIFKNEIIMDLIKILGCGVDLPKKYSKAAPPFDIDRLRWNKVIICTDADVDGFQIRTLILAMFYKLAPELIRQQKIFIAESPLYEISHQVKRLESTYFVYSDQEKNKLVESLGEGRIHVQRSKGLGENEPGMMWNTTMNPETRRLIAVMPEDEDTMRDAFNLLLGDDIPGRRACIEKTGHLYMGMLDVG
ncbi:MAG TPA: toprim domain-containing protein [Clostridia bacterium]|nr:toprim domain-containing protein [Clostridia bacterium]